MKRILKSKKGVTILEGLIALMLLALVATGTFAVLLSTSRKSSAPDIREEMALAVERANNLVQAYVLPSGMTDLGSAWCNGSSGCTTNFATGLCGNDLSPMGTGTHIINCMLPPICDPRQSRFAYIVNTVNKSIPLTAQDSQSSSSSSTMYSVRYEISCNGFTL